MSLYFGSNLNPAQCLDIDVRGKGGIISVFATTLKSMRSGTSKYIVNCGCFQYQHEWLATWDAGANSMCFLSIIRIRIQLLLLLLLPPLGVPISKLLQQGM